MSFLSRTTLPGPLALRAGLTDGYAWHKALWRSFPNQPEARRRFLFRVDRQGKIFQVYLLSPMRPETSDLTAWETKEIPSSFLEHAAYRFKIKANPTMRRAADRRRLAIFDEPRLRDWIMRKASAAGFDLDSGRLVVGAPVVESFVKKRRNGKHVVVDFEGVLKVRDSGTFREAFTAGIGSAKGFGYGMLMLQPVGQ